MSQNRVRHIKQCYSIHHADSNAGMRFAYGLDGAIASNYMDPFKGVPRMKIEVRDQIEYVSLVSRELRLQVQFRERHS